METHQDGGSGTRKQEGPNIQGMPACFQSSFIYFTDSMTTPHPPNNENTSCSLLDGCWTSNRSKRGSKLGPASIPMYDAFFFIFSFILLILPTSSTCRTYEFRPCFVFARSLHPNPAISANHGISQIHVPCHVTRSTSLPLCHDSAITAPSPTRSNVPTTRSGLQRGNPPLAKRKRSNADEQTRKRPKSEKDDDEEIEKGKGGRDGKKEKKNNT